MSLSKTAEQKISDIHAFIEAKADEYERRLDDVEGDIKVLHGRINSAIRWFTGLLLSLNTAWGGILAYFKLKG